MKYLFLFLACSLLQVNGISQAKDLSTVQTDNLTNDIFIQKSFGDTILTVFWLPKEYWRVSLQESPNISREQARMVEDLMGDYALIMISGVTHSNDGSFVSIPNLESEFSLSNQNRVVFQPLSDDDLSTLVISIRNELQPMLASMLGQFGQSMSLMFYQDKVKRTKRNFDPYKSGEVQAVFFGKKFVFQTALPSLMEDKICPESGEKYPYNFKFCPMCGVEVKEQTTVVTSD